MAGLHKRGQVWWASYVKHGKQVRVSLKTKDKREANYKLKELTRHIYSYTLNGLYVKWYEDNSYRLSTSYTSLVARSIQKFGLQRHDPPISKITHHDLSEYQAFLGLTLSRTSVKMYMKQFRVLMNYAVNTLRVLEENPFDRVVIVKGRKREDSMTWKQVNNILIITRKVRPILSSFLELLFLTGMRLGELENLLWSNVYEDCFCIEVSKTEAGLRTINLNDETSQCFRHIKFWQPEDCEYVLSSEKGEWLGGYRWLSKQFSKYRGLAGVPKKFVCHSLRHTYASMLRQHGYNLDDIQLSLGHKDIKTTMKYVKRRDIDVFIKSGFYKNL